MKRKFPRPKILVSRCLGFENCRYNAGIIRSRAVDVLAKYTDVITVCPETGIGLTVPRDPVRIVVRNGEPGMYQPSSGLWFTDEMKEYSERILNENRDVDGVIVKSKSPSCGRGDVKLYNADGRIVSGRKSSGIFAGRALSFYEGIPFEDEGRLHDRKLREKFFTFLFAFADFRIKSHSGISGLIKFQSRNKLLFMAYNQTIMRKMGFLLAQNKKMEEGMIMSEYEILMKEIFQKNARYTNEINSLMHAFGYVSKKMSQREKKNFLEALEDYRMGYTSVQAPLALMKSLVERFEEKYLIEQTYFQRYPAELDIINSEEER